MKQGYKEKYRNRGLKIRYTKNGRLKQKYVKKYQTLNNNKEKYGQGEDSDDENLLEQIQLEDISGEKPTTQKNELQNQ